MVHSLRLIGLICASIGAFVLRRASGEMTSAKSSLPNDNSVICNIAYWSFIVAAATGILLFVWQVSTIEKEFVRAEKEYLMSY